jgi:hypothetical protein
MPAKAKARALRAKPKAQTKTKAVKKDKSNQENLPPVIDIVDSDDELEKDENLASGWLRRRLVSANSSSDRTPMRSDASSSTRLIRATGMFTSG